MIQSSHTGQRGRAYDAHRGIHGHIRVAGASTRLIVATDASYKHGIGGFGYFTRNGYWGLATRHSGRGRLAAIRDHGTGSLVNEIRAVGLVIEHFPGRAIKFLIDSTAAIDHLHSWQAGHTDRMPRGYSLRPRVRGDATPALVRYAHQIAGRTDLKFVHVAGHSGHLMNEAADTLATIARTALTPPSDEYVLGERAASVAAAFLYAIHDPNKLAVAA
ncbi:ribonuclease HI [Nocardia farcinica]|uniref:ribonuclease HI n=1 Tax=Nocardia farcinica TaxID=37329 RepID=UPI0024540D68|nr:RNase H family protein [Nocardia farcinica]